MSQINTTACIGGGFEVLVNGNIYNEANPAGTEILTATNGCDSVVTIDLNFEFCCEILVSNVTTTCLDDETFAISYQLDFDTPPGLAHVVSFGGFTDTIPYGNSGDIVTIEPGIIGDGLGTLDLLISDSASLSTASINPDVFISEIHYDNDGTDVDEGFEISGISGIDLAGYTVVIYDGGDSLLQGSPVSLSGILTGSTCGSIFFPTGLQNSTEGIALVDPSGQVVEFLSYEGTILALVGPALGLTSIDIVVSQPSSTPSGETLQLTDAGWILTDETRNFYNDNLSCNANPDPDLCRSMAIVDVPFCMEDCNIEVVSALASCDELSRVQIEVELTSVNPLSGDLVVLLDTLLLDTLPYPAVGTTLLIPTDILGTGQLGQTITIQDAASNPGTTGIFISEIHYDNDGTDEDEGFEITAPQGTDLSGYMVVEYDGGDNMTQGSPVLLSGVVTDADCGAIFFIEGLQNSTEGLALIDPNGTVIEFISYEGIITALDGPAMGLTSTDIGVSQASSTPIGFTLQLTDSGWVGPTNESRNSVNDNLSCVEPVEPIICETMVVLDFPTCPIFDLSVDKMVTPGQSLDLAPGDLVSFDILVANDGEAAAFDIILRDLFGEDFVFISDLNPGWDSDGTFIIDRIDPGESIIIQINLQIPDDFTGNVLANTAEAVVASLTPGGMGIPDIDADEGGNPSDEEIDTEFIRVCQPGATPFPIVSTFAVCDLDQNTVLIEPVQAEPAVLFEDFETNGNGSRYTTSVPEFTDGAEDYFLRTDGSNITGESFEETRGSFYFAAKDLDGVIESRTATITFAPADIQGLCDLSLSLYIAEDDQVVSGATEHWDEDDFVHIDYSIDGAPFSNGIHIEANSSQSLLSNEPRIDTNFDGIGDGQEITDTFSLFSTLIQGSGSSIVVRVTIQLDAAAEDIAFDDVQILGSPSAYNIYESDPNNGGVLLLSGVRAGEVPTPAPGETATYFVETLCGPCRSEAVMVEVDKHPGESSLACLSTVNIFVGPDCNITDLDNDIYYTTDLDPSFVVVEVRDGQGLVVDPTNIREFVGAEDLIYEIKDTCTMMSCWGRLNIEAKSRPEPIIVTDTLCCITDIPDGLILSEQEVSDILDASCIAPHTQISVETSYEGELCDTVNQTISYFARFEVDGVVERSLVYEHLVTTVPLDLSQVIGPGTDMISDSMSRVDTIIMEACGTFDFSPESIAAFFADRIDPGDAFANGNAEGIPFAYPHIIKDTTFIEELSIFQTIEETIVEESVFLDGLWVVLDVVQKDTILDTTINLIPVPVYIPLDSETLCNASVQYEDTFFEGCFDRSKLRREWTILDWCTGDLQTFVQFVEIIDTEAPEFRVIETDIELIGTDSIRIGENTFAIDDPQAMVSVDTDLLFAQVDILNPSTCEASFRVPEFPRLRDNCTATEDLVFTYEINDIPVEPDPNDDRLLEGFPSGSSTLVITATDRCGNSVSHSMTIFALDQVPPQVICRDQINVTLGDDQGLLDGGRVLVGLDHFDAGSFDFCGDIILVLAQRLDNKFFCDGTFIQAISTEALEFCCEDIGSPIPVQLTYFDNFGNRSICWSTILIQDKFPPEIVVDDISLECFDTTDPEVIGVPDIINICGDLELTYDDDLSSFNTQCNTGTIRRLWSIVSRPEITATQIISVNERLGNVFNPYEIKWPKHYDGRSELGVSRECEIWRGGDGAPILDDLGNLQNRIVEYEEEIEMRSTFTCVQQLDTGEPVWCNASCSIIQSNFETLEVEASDACKKIIRQWTIIDWCTWQANDTDSDDDSGDTFQAVDDKWLDELSSDNRGRWLTDARQRSSTPPNNFDEFGRRSDGRVTTLPCTTCEKAGSPAQEVYFRYLSVDMDGFYTFDQVITIEDNESPMIDVDAQLSVFISGGATSKDDDFDDCISSDVVTAEVSNSCDTIVLGTQDISWTIQVYRSNLGRERLELLRTKSENGPSVTVNSEFGSAGDHHLIVWQAVDGCGNTSIEETLVRFVDIVRPTPLCIQDISTAVMVNGEVEIWASDFDAGSFDNCSAVRHFFFLDSEGLPTEDEEAGSFIPNLIVTCDVLRQFGNGETLSLDVFVLDDQGSGDYCTISLNVNGAQDQCDLNSTTSSISGSIYSSRDKLIPNVQVSAGDELDVTDEIGSYIIQPLPISGSYSVEPVKNDDLLDGISILDLVIIQRHILGISPLQSPEQLVAADINNDQRISTIDLVELRSAVLGLSDHFSGNTSWRFVDETYNLNMDSHRDGFPERKVIDELAGRVSNVNFMGIKIGDVNGSALQSAVSRSHDLADLTIDNIMLSKGIPQHVSIDLPAEDITHGIDITLHREGLSILDIWSPGLELSTQQVDDKYRILGLNPDGAHQGRIHLSVVSDDHGPLADFLSLDDLSPKVIVQSKDVERTVQLVYIQGGQDQLYQNIPNPFNQSTTIRMRLESPGTATVHIHDLTGRVIWSKTDDYTAGVQELTIQKENLQGTGFYMYTLEKDGTRLTKRMILLD